MVGGVRGRLVTGSFARDLLSTVPGAGRVPAGLPRALERWWQRCETTLGPASSVRAIADVCVVPLLELLGYSISDRSDATAECRLQIRISGRPLVIASVIAWKEPLARSWRDCVTSAIAADVRWCFCCNGPALRVVDARRTWSRDFLEFDLDVLAWEPVALSLLWATARAEAMAAEPPVLEHAIALSARHGLEVCRALGAGVLQALQLLLRALSAGGRCRYTAEVLFEHALTVLYRVLFLLFAEARGLVPLWHPLYRDRYSVQAIVDTLIAGGRYRGLWRAVQAISRLAHAGCSAGELTVTAFNGRLFAPATSAAFDRTRIDDDVMGRTVMAVSVVRSRTGAPKRIAYRDLDVEQLGAVYEQVLDYQPGAGGSVAPLIRTGDQRKSTGTFYTPRAVTAFLVRRTLEPLVAGRDADAILALRVLDPAMGSGAFLVAACRYLAHAMEEALIREGRWHRHDVTATDRVVLRREIASRCLFGVDLNPMAVQLARLSLWLATLSADKPLSFLDHHLVTGNSLVGATPGDVSRQPPGGRSRSRPRSLPLLDDVELASTLGAGARVRLQLSAEHDDSAAIVRAKEQALAALQRRDAALGRWTRVLDLWCAGWFWDDGAAPDRGTFAALADLLVRDRHTLPERVSSRLIAQADAIATRLRFLHWPLAFPEVFVEPAGASLAVPGFDAVIGNPPWDMVRGDSGDDATRTGRRDDARRLIAFVRESGVYQVESRAHANRYQLFLERALQLVRTGGRIGLVLPGGSVSDAGAAPLRRHLFDRADVDSVTGLDNREAIFPIHRSVRFVLLTATAGGQTSEIRCRFGITRPDDLERFEAPERARLVVTRRLLARLSGEHDLGIPDLRGAADLALVERISATVPRLSSAEGWNAHFGRELNATDDREKFTPATCDRTARLLVEGKQIDPFRVALERSTFQLREDADVRIPRRPRLAYRDVASATNRLTLIAAIVPARAVTTHTLFCLKTPLAAADQHVLCALLNSYVANYLIRMRVNTHVTVALVARLPVPLVRRGDSAHERLASLARTLMTSTCPVEEAEEYAELQAVAAHLYRLTPEEFAHVLETFPLMPEATKARALQWFRHSDSPRCDPQRQ